MRFLLVKSTSRAGIFAGTLRCIIGGSPKFRGVEIIPATSAVCRPLSTTSTSALISQADGESLGTLPAEITTVHDAFALLMPPP